ncbi:TadE/TadG family type IV pilus assembly protein [Indiicoccus explosivorum]|uniref:TadE/TadG family type IV pilus assembly protein n=1 Tax=Indiicoccus explosivorum TaxID=1917864 RepID=UPI000B4406F3|nr:TadE/TadG family type IV pilus assembly protein [Indiicoccus explosivorum]
MRKKEDGQSLVEFALVLPLILLLLVGVIDFGRILQTHLQMELVTQEAVRLGGLGQTDEAIRAFAKQEFEAKDPALLTVSVTPSGIRPSGTYVTVEMSYPEDLFTPLGDFALPYTVTASSTIRVE